MPVYPESLRVTDDPLGIQNRTRTPPADCERTSPTISNLRRGIIHGDTVGRVEPLIHNATANAQQPDEGKTCSNETLKGSYGGAISGTR